MLKSVDLPAPFGPISEVIEPRSTAKLAPSTARTPPNEWLSSRTSSMLGRLMAELRWTAHSSTISSLRPRIPWGRKSISPISTSPISISRT